MPQISDISFDSFSITLVAELEKVLLPNNFNLKKIKLPLHGGFF
jgi:hypothetical protein